MVEITDIKDEESLGEWLEGRSREESIWIATRAAMRVLPVFWEWTFSSKARQGGFTVLPVLRSLLASSVVAVRPSEDNKARVSAAQGADETACTSGSAPTQAAPYAFVAAQAAANVAVIPEDHAALQAASATQAAIASKYAADAAFAGAAAWNATQADCGHIAVVESETPPQLWPQTENASEPEWSLVKATATEPEWAFWIAWYQDALDGVPPDWDLLERIALIENAIWEAGPKAVADEIERIRKEHLTDPESLNRKLRHLPEAKPEVVERVRSAMERNRQELPPTFDAVESLILLEIERLQTRNYVDDFDRDESVRQIGVYLTLHAAITELRAQVPIKGKIEVTQAEKSERLLTLYWKEFAKLPRAKVGEVVEGAWETGKGICQVGLIGMSTYMGMQYQLPPMAGVTIGALCFAPKKAGDIIKHAKDALIKSGN